LRDIINNNNINSLFILGKHKLYSIACEGALKIKEVTYIHCEGFSAGSLKHGPFALLNNTNLTLLLIDYNDIANYANIKSTYYEILGRETNIFVITNSQNVIDELQIDDNKHILLYKLDYYNEVIFTVLLQKLAYEISIVKGLNPDKAFLTGTSDTVTVVSITTASSTDATAGTVAGSKKYTVFMPTTAGPVTLSATLASASPLAAAIQAKVISATTTVTDSGSAALAAVTALATTVASLRTLIVTLTNLVLKIQKKVKA
jgi:fructoselysine-6-P-deglycase FrlB-like protein